MSWRECVCVCGGGGGGGEYWSNKNVNSSGNGSIVMISESVYSNYPFVWKSCNLSLHCFGHEEWMNNVV